MLSTFSSGGHDHSYDENPYEVDGYYNDGGYCLGMRFCRGCAEMTLTNGFSHHCQRCDSLPGSGAELRPGGLRDWLETLRYGFPPVSWADCHGNNEFYAVEVCDSPEEDAENCSDTSGSELQSDDPESADNEDSELQSDDSESAEHEDPELQSDDSESAERDSNAGDASRDHPPLLYLETVLDEKDLEECNRIADTAWYQVSTWLADEDFEEWVYGIHASSRRTRARTRCPGCGYHVLDVNHIASCSNGYIWTYSETGRNGDKIFYEIPHERDPSKVLGHRRI